MKSMKRPARKERVKKGIYVLPNLFTTASLFCGFYAILAAMKGLFDLAAVAILISAVLDGLDGRIARMTNTTSKFGVEYDSLADLVAFGVAPAVLLYKWSLFDLGKWGFSVAFLFMVCGALRLARFNVQVGVVDSKVFNGLPIPGAAAVVASSVLLFYKLGGKGEFHHPVVPLAAVLLSFFMVSSIKYYSFKDLNLFARKPFVFLVLLVVILILIITEPQIIIFTLVTGYSISGPFLFFTREFQKYFRKIKEHRLKKKYITI
ncbi:MAG: CDP-diacylglycerol--serine O-phosphatidyltransferase [Syntrophales bacterium]|nr:CDP-diacylglycerol--serine O-phosphatidyltransferase [Syntrophales bacterium]